MPGGSGTEIAAKVYMSRNTGIVPGTEVLGQIKVKGQYSTEVWRR